MVRRGGFEFLVLHDDRQHNNRRDLMRYKIIVLTSVLIVMLTGCINGPMKPYEFRQEFENIKTIEIATKAYGYSDPTAPMNTIKTLDPSEHQTMIDAILDIPGQRITPPGTGFGPYIIIISYDNGEKEYLGAWNNGYVLADGTTKQDTYLFNEERFYALISSCLGKEITPPTGPDPTAPISDTGT